jgi:hypothetical protein
MGCAKARECRPQATDGRQQRADSKQQTADQLVSGALRCPSRLLLHVGRHCLQLQAHQAEGSITQPSNLHHETAFGCRYRRKARQGKVRQGKARQGKARQGEAHLILAGDGGGLIRAENGVQIRALVPPLHHRLGEGNVRVGCGGGGNGGDDGAMRENCLGSRGGGGDRRERKKDKEREEREECTLTLPTKASWPLAHRSSAPPASSSATFVNFLIMPARLCKSGEVRACVCVCVCVCV